MAPSKSPSSFSAFPRLPYASAMTTVQKVRTQQVTQPSRHSTPQKTAHEPWRPPRDPPLALSHTARTAGATVPEGTACRRTRKVGVDADGLLIVKNAFAVTAQLEVHGTQQQQVVCPVRVQLVDLVTRKDVQERWYTRVKATAATGLGTVRWPDREGQPTSLLPSDLKRVSAAAAGNASAALAAPKPRRA